MLRRLLLLSALLIGLFGAIAVVMHLPPVRARIRDQVVRKLEEALGTTVGIERLEFSLLGHTASLYGVSIRSRTSPPELLGTASRINVDIPLSAIFGEFSLRSVEVEDVQAFSGPLSQQRSATPTSIAPRAASIPDIPINRIQIRGLDIVGSEDQPIRVDAKGLSIDLTRTAPGQFGAELHARGGVTVAAVGTSMELSSVDGSLALDGERLLVKSFRLAGSDVDLAAAGQVVIAGEAPVLALNAEGTVDLGRLGSMLPVRLAPAGGIVHVKLNAEGPLKSPHVAAEARATSILLSNMHFESVTVKGDASASLIALQSIVADTMGGHVAGSATIERDRATPSDRFHLTWNDLDCEQLFQTLGLKAPVRIAASLDGRADLSGSVASPDSLVGRIDATLDRRAGSRGLSPEGRVAIDLDPKRVTVDLNQRLAQVATLVGRVQTNRTARGADPLSGQVTMAAPDAGRLWQTLRDAGLSASARQLDGVRGPMSASIALTGTLATPSASVAVSAPALSMAGSPLFNARIDATLSPERMTIGSARIEQGANLVEASAQMGMAKGDLAGRFDVTIEDSIALQRLTGFQSDALPDAGHFSFAGALGGRLIRPTVTGALTGRDVRWTNRRVDSFDAHVDVDGTRISFSDLDASEGRGKIRGSGSYDLRTERYDVDLNAADVQYSTNGSNGASSEQLPAALSFVGGGLFKGAGRLPDPNGSGELALSDIQWRGRRLGPAHVRLIIEHGTARLESEAVNFGAVIAGTMATARPWRFLTSVTLDGRNVEWPPADASTSTTSLFHGSIAATLTAKGALADWRHTDLALDLRRVDGTLGGLPVMLTRRARLEWTEDGLNVPEELALAVGSFAATARGHVGASGGRFNLAMDGNLADAAPLARLATTRPVELDGRVHLKAEASGTYEHPTLAGELSVEGGRLNAGFAQPISVNGSVRLDQGVFHAENLSATWEQSSAATTASVPTRFLARWLPGPLSRLPTGTGPSSATVHVTNLSSTMLSAFLPPETLQRFEGWADASVVLETAETAMSDMHGSVTLERAQLRVGELVVDQVGSMTGPISGGRVDFSGWQWKGPSTDITLGGHVGLGTPLTYDIGAIGAVDLQLLAIAMPGKFAGRATAILRVTPESGKPSMTGRLVFRNGAWFDRGLQVALSDVKGIVRLDADGVRLQDLRGNFNGGDVSLDGRVTGPDAAIAATAHNMTIELPGAVRSEMDADLKLSLGVNPTLTGRITLLPGTVRSSLRALASVASSANQQSNQRGSTALAAFLSRTKMDVAVSSSEDLVFDSNDLQLQVGADLKLTGTVAQPGLLGRATIREGGEIYFSGRRYTISTGSIEFVDPAGIVPSFNIVSDTQVAEYDVTMRLSGRPDRLTTTLTSDPPLGQSDLVSLLTTGRTVAQGGSSSQATSDQLLALVSTEALGFFGRLFGLDVVRIEQGSRDLSTTDLDPVARLTVSKYLTNGFELVYSQSLRESGDLTWIVLYRPGWRNLEFRLNVRSLESNTLEVRQEFTFGGGRAPAERTRRRHAKVTGLLIKQVGFLGLGPADQLDLQREIKLTAGKHFDLAEWQKDRERIERHFWRLNHLRVRVGPSRRANAEDKTVDLMYSIDPGPLTRLTIAGYTPSHDTMDQMRDAWSRAPVDEFLGDDLTNAVRRDLAARGYLRPEVVASIRPLGEGADREAVVSVVPGSASRRRTLDLGGNTKIADTLLLRTVEARVPEPDRWLRPELVKTPIDDVYRSRGYLNVKITVGQLAFDGERVSLPVTIEEGQAFHVSTVVVQGRQRLDEAEVLSVFGLAAGSSYSPPAAVAGIERVKDTYRLQGFDEATTSISSSLDRQASTIALTLNIAEGPRRVLEAVSFAGRTGTSRGLLKDVVNLNPGEPGGMSRIELARQRLYQTGIFRSVDLDIQPPAPSTPSSSPGDQPVRATFALEELPRYRFRYGVEFGSALFDDPTTSTRTGSDKGLTLDFRRNNLFGQGISAGVGGSWAPSRTRIRGLLSSSVFLGDFAESTLVIDRVDETQTIGEVNIDQVETIVTAEQRRRLSRHDEISYGYQLDDSTVTLELPFIGKFPIATKLSGLTTTWTRDTRNNLFNPSTGLFMSNRLEGGAQWMFSDLGYLRYLGQFYAFRSAGPITFASALRFGTLALSNVDELATLSLRFQAGGGTTVRGYEQDSLSPQLSTDFPLGGNALLILNQEVRFPIFGYLGGVGFIDAGNTFPEVHLLSFSDLKVGVGFGLRLNIPFAVFRTDLGFPWPREENGPRSRWYFSIGHAF